VLEEMWQALRRGRLLLPLLLLLLLLLIGCCNRPTRRTTCWQRATLGHNTRAICCLQNSKRYTQCRTTDTYIHGKKPQASLIMQQDMQRSTHQHQPNGGGVKAAAAALAAARQRNMCLL